tara:strand:- start:65509 stop:65748 length:240 start_codon:yes stop_codon:yes gene_type:complete
MTPKKKAKELVDKFNEDSRFWDCYNDVPLEERHDKNCALICVNEIAKAFNFPKYDGDPDKEINGDQIYWYDVKQEIEKL